MPSPTDLEFDGDRQRIYRFVDRNGPVAPDVVAEAVRVDPESFQHHVTILQRDDLLETDDVGRLRVPMQSGEAVEHAEAGVEYSIRPARAADLSGVVGVIRSVTDEAPYIVAEGLAEQLAYEGTLTRRCPQEYRIVFVATVEGDVVGWAHVETPELSKLSNTAELTMGVLATYRRHGIGSHLLQRGVEWAASRDSRKVYNSLPATNERAIEFLETVGWEIEAIRPDHYELDGELVDEVMLARHLTD